MTADLQTKPNNLACRLLSLISIIAICYYYLAQKRYSFYRPTKSGRFSQLGHCSMGVQVLSDAGSAVDVIINTSAHDGIQAKLICYKYASI